MVPWVVGNHFNGLQSGHLQATKGWGSNGMLRNTSAGKHPAS